MQSRSSVAFCGNDNHGDGSNIIDQARVILAYRRARDAEFGADLFGEPVWEIQLVLVAYDLDAHGLTVSEIAKHINCNTNSLWRWLAVMIDRDIVQSRVAGDEQYYSLTSRSRKAISSISV